MEKTFGSKLGALLAMDWLGNAIIAVRDALYLLTGSLFRLIAYGVCGSPPDFQLHEIARNSNLET